MSLTDRVMFHAGCVLGSVPGIQLGANGKREWEGGSRHDGVNAGEAPGDKTLGLKKEHNIRLHFKAPPILAALLLLMLSVN